MVIGERTSWWSGAGARSVVAGVAEVRDAARRVLVEHDVPHADAELTAGHLVEGDLRGYPAQGVERLLQVTEMFRCGTLEPRPVRSVRQNRAAAAILDGGNGLGPPATAEAVGLARRIARDTGVAVVGLRRCGHQGILADWVEQAAGADCFALLASASEPGVVPPGGTAPLFGTNPLAYSWPTPDGPLTADFSTAAISRSALLRRMERDEPLPAGVAVGPDGAATRDPAEALRGGLLPIAPGHKGTLVSLLVAALAGPVVGGPPSHAVVGTRRPETAPDKGDFLLVIDLAATTRVEEFGRAAIDFRAAATRAGVLRLPGEAARRRRATTFARGIAVAEPVARLLWPKREPAP